MKKAVCLSVLILSATALVACGGDDSGDGEDDPTTFCPARDQTTGGGGQTVVVKADPSGAPKFTPTSLQANAGEVTIELKNPSPKCHDVAIEGKGGEALGHTKRVKQGTADVTLNLDPGAYTYFSTIPGEQDAGAVGKLTVK
jgi:plastocyanin